MYSKEKQQEHISQIRRVLVIQPNATILGVQAILANKKKQPLKLHKDYINRLINKIRKERAKRLDNYTVNVVLAKFQDEVEELKRRLWLIITNAMTPDKDKVAAIKELRQSSKDIFDKMFDSGIFTKKIGELTVDRKFSKEEQELLDKAIELDYGKPNEHSKNTGEDKN